MKCFSYTCSQTSPKGDDRSAAAMAAAAVLDTSVYQGYYGIVPFTLACVFADLLLLS